MPTTWNLNWQCIDPFEVAVDTFQKVLSTTEMVVGRKDGQFLTQHEVLDFVGWFPFCTHEEFDKHCASTLN